MLARDLQTERTPADRALDLLRQLPADRLGVATGTEVSLAAPIAKFRITGSVIRPRVGLAEIAYHWGWRYFVVTNGKMLPRAIDVRPGRNAGSWRAGLTSGRQVSDQLKCIDRLQDDRDLSGTLRLIDAPGLDWSGLWIVAQDRHQLVSLAHGRTIDVARLMAKLRRTARRQHVTAEIRAGARTARTFDIVKGEHHDD